MSTHDKDQDKEKKNLVTERDNDDEFGLFKEDSFPESAPDEIQKRVIDNELPHDNELPRHKADKNKPEIE